MNALLGFSGIFFVTLITIFFSFKFPDIKRVLYVALFIRITLIISGNYIFPLPDSGYDADTFETRAWNWSQGGFFSVFNYYTGPNYNFISWILALLYSLVGERSMMLTQSVSLFFGMGTIFLGCSLARKIWNTHIAIKVGWCLALFPSLVLYSCLTLREAYIWFFLLIALLGVTNWIQDKSIKSIIIGFTGFLLATFFHSAMFVGAATFFALIVLDNLKKMQNSFLRLKINVPSLVLLCFFISIVVFYNFNEFKINLDYFNKNVDIEKIIKEIRNRQGGDGSYPDWTKPNTPIELFYKAPIRIIYFLFSPFPWDILKFSHVIGLFDSILYMWLFYLILSNFREVVSNPKMRIIFFILIPYLLVFGIVIGNFGTSIRHKTKILIAIILLAAPKLPYFVAKRINKEN